MEYINFAVANYGTIIAGLLAIVGGFSIIAKLTPTPKDDEILAKVVKVLDFLAMNKQRVQ
jgi:hypothetical protein